jgi:hypothetical protein
MTTTPEHDAQMAKMTLHQFILTISQKLKKKLVDELAKGKNMEKILRQA